MRYDENGAVIKYCMRCGRKLTIENYFAGVRQKYCKECAAQAKREQTALCLRNKREKARERRTLEREQNRMLIDENALLREQVRALQSRVETLGRIVEKLKDENG